MKVLKRHVGCFVLVEFDDAPSEMAIITEVVDQQDIRVIFIFRNPRHPVSVVAQQICALGKCATHYGNDAIENVQVNDQGNQI